MKTLNITIFTFIYISASAQMVTLESGSGLVKGGLSYVTANGYFDNDGEVQELLDYRTIAFNIHAEYAISRKFNAYLKGPLFMSSSADLVFSGGVKNTKSASSMGDLELALKYDFFSGRQYELSLSAGAFLPTGVDNNIYGLNTGYGLMAPSARVDGKYIVNPHWYASAYIQFTRRSEGFTDEIASGGEVGWKVSERIWAIFHLKGIDPLENGDDGLSGGLPGLYHNNSGFLKPGIEADFMFGNLGLFLAGFYPVKGQFVHAAPDFHAGVFYIFKSKSDPVEDDNSNGSN